jgi:hypothetical protein
LCLLVVQDPLHAQTSSNLEYFHTDPSFDFAGIDYGVL